MLIKNGLLAAGAFCMLWSASSQAALHDRGAGLIYDDVLNVTWLQDANYSKTSGFDDNGKMTWSGATQWVDQLSYFDSVRNTTWNDWRLPTVAPVNSSGFNYSWHWTGATDEGYNIVSPNSELSYMYYVNLGLNGWYLPNGIKQSTPFGVLGTTSAVWQGQANVGPFQNIQSFMYWSNTEGSDYSNRDAWTFITAEGGQRDGFPRPDAAFAWAVRDGDVASPIPEPSTWAMLLLGCGFIVNMGRRARQH